MVSIAAAECLGVACWCDVKLSEGLGSVTPYMRQFNITRHYEFTCERWREKKVVLFGFRNDSIGQSLSKSDWWSIFPAPGGHSNVWAWDSPRLQRDRWDLVCFDLAELIFLPGLVCCLIIKGAIAINIGGILQRHCLLGQDTIHAKKNHNTRVTRQRLIIGKWWECHVRNGF